MKPNRPGSAKSRVTQVTYDTDKLNESRMSQTTTQNANFRIQKKDDFEEYLKQKQKDPQFKRLHKGTLDSIPQTEVKPQLNKINSKPFDKRNSSRILDSSSKKKQSTEQKSAHWTVNQPCKKKQNKQQEMASSKGNFADKQKQKLNSVISAPKDTAEKPGQSKVNLKGFTKKVPGKRSPQEFKVEESNQFLAQPISISPSTQESKEQQERPKTSEKEKNVAKKTEQEAKRQEEMLEISRFINEVEMRNINNYPQGYEQFVERNQSQVDDIEKINIADFMNEPTEKDYNKIHKRIQQNQKYFTEQQEVQSLAQSRLTQNSSQNNAQKTEQSSIDLDRMIDGSEEHSHLQNSQIFLSSISSQDLKQRNLFLTEILKGRITKDEIDKMEDLEKSQIKMMKLQQPEKEEDYDKVEMVQINMMKKKSNRLLERNKIEASGQVYRDCDYLSDQNKQRLQKLLSGEVESSPFEASQWDQFAMRRLDEGIRIYREFTASIQGTSSVDQISEEYLPKDPQLRKQAEKKLLKQKIDSINNRLREVDQVVINQSKIKSIIQTYSDSTKLTEQSKRLIQEKKHEYQSLEQKNQEVQKMLESTESQKKKMQALLQEMEKQYRAFEQQKEVISKMTTEEFRNHEKESLQVTKSRLRQIQVDMAELQKGTQRFQRYGEQLEGHISVLRQLDTCNLNNIIPCGSFADQTEEDLDAKFNKMAESRHFQQISLAQESDQE